MAKLLYFKSWKSWILN